MGGLGMGMDKPIRALALVGMAGSGKTICAQHLQQQGFYQFRFGGIVTDEVERRGWVINPNNERIVREEFRANEGMDVMAKRAMPYLRAALETYPVIVIDGLYSFSEYKTLKRELDDTMVVVAVVCSRDKRYERLAQRTDRPLTRAEAEERDYAEIENMEKGGPIAIADYTLNNDGEPDELLAKLDELLQQLAFYPSRG
jgi:dephospho-CoA kinase